MRKKTAVNRQPFSILDFENVGQGVAPADFAGGYLFLRNVVVMYVGVGEVFVV